MLPFKECRRHGVLQDKDKYVRDERPTIECKICNTMNKKIWTINNKKIGSTNKQTTTF